jgi:putative oxidoreductase
MIKSLWNFLLKTEEGNANTSNAVILIRLMVGGVFLSEGIQKFLYADALGIGRFIKIGIPFPAITAPLVGIVEILFGGLILFGILTRLSTIPLVINISVAIFTTKIPMLMHEGFWKATHETRVDASMLLGLIFLLIVGSGSWSIDYRRAK